MRALYVLPVLAVLALAGCANITPQYNSYGELVGIKSTKFMADLTAEQILEYGPDGKVTKKTIRMETKTNADRILGEVVKGAGLAVGTAGNLMP